MLIAVMYTHATGKSARVFCFLFSEIPNLMSFSISNTSPTGLIGSKPKSATRCPN